MLGPQQFRVFLIPRAMKFITNYLTTGKLDFVPYN